MKKKTKPKVNTTSSTSALGFTMTPLRHVSKEQADTAIAILRTQRVLDGELREKAERALHAYLDANHAKIEATTIGGNAWTFGPTSIGTF